MTAFRSTLIALAASLALLAGSAGCESNGDDEDVEVSGQDRISTPRESSADRTGAPRDIPSGAQLLSDWRDDRLSYKPDRDGTVYIYDDVENRVVFSSRVSSDERFIFDRRLHRATIDGRTVFSLDDADRDRTHGYRIYFVQESPDRI